MLGGVPAPNASNFPCDGHYVLRFTFCEEVKMEGTPEKVERARSDLEYWAAPVERLKVTELTSGGTGLNVDGRRVVGPLQGFGQLWQKTYRVRLTNAPVTPAEVVRVW